MGQYALLAVLAVMTVGAVVLYTAQRTAQAADDDLTAYHEDRFSRELATVGLKRTERLLSAQPDDWGDAGANALYGAPPTTYTKDNLTGTYEVTFDSYTPKTSTTPEIAHVTARGVYNGETFTIKAVYEQGETDVGLPPQMREAIVSDNRLYLNGNIEISGSVHTNDCLDSSGNSFDVYGTGTYTGCDGANDSRFTGGVQQQDSIYVDPVTIPTSWTHRTPAGAAASLGNQTTNLTTTGMSATLTPGGGSTFTVTGAGTAANPYILVVRGNLTVTGDVRLIRGFSGTTPLQGHIRIYVDGNFEMAGNSKLAPVTGTLPRQQDPVATNLAWRDANLPDGSTIGVYATGDIILTGTMTVIGSLYANGEVQYKGGGQKMVMGGITTKDQIEVKGNSQIVYTEANTSILDPGGNTQTPDGIRLAGYREWAER